MMSATEVAKIKENKNRRKEKEKQKEKKGEEKERNGHFLDNINPALQPKVDIFPHPADDLIECSTNVRKKKNFFLLSHNYQEKKEKATNTYIPR